MCYKKGMNTLRTIRTERVEHGTIETRVTEYKTVSIFSYWAFIKNGHIIGYSAKLDVILKRLNKYAKTKKV